MKWQGRRGSDNIEDRRAGGGGRTMAMGGGLGIVVLIIGFLMGGDPMTLLKNFQQQGAVSQQAPNAPLQESAQEKQLAQFVSVVLADNEQIWDQVFRENGMTYRKPKLVLFRSSVQSGCGGATAQTGPFYCPADEKIYIDLSFFDDLTKKLGAHGEFSLAYVIAHEVGHHVQHLLGTSNKVRQLQSKTNEVGANRLSVALELQADFYAGLWTNHNAKYNQVIEQGDIEEALSAANAVGDDRLQQQAQGRVVPDAFTHGTSEQRMYWFKRGFQTGDMKQGDTFSELRL